jgi:hypothetical protein
VLHAHAHVAVELSVKKFQNNIYFICNCVNSVNRDDMFKMATGLDGVILAVSIFMLFNRIIDYPAKLELRTLSCMIEDLGFYANNINSTLYDDFVLEKFTPQKQTSKVGSKRHHTNTKYHSQSWKLAPDRRTASDKFPGGQNHPV